MRTKPIAEPIHVEIAKGQQDFVYTGFFRTEDGLKVRIRIKRDSYAFQSYAIAEVWSITDARWNEVASIHYSKMVPSDAYGKQSEFEAAAAVDAIELLRIVKEVA